MRSILPLAKISAVQEISGWFAVLAEVVWLAAHYIWFDFGARAEGSAMSFVAWQILRRLPKPLLLVGIIFVLVAAAKA